MVDRTNAERQKRYRERRTVKNVAHLEAMRDMAIGMLAKIWKCDRIEADMRVARAVIERNRSREKPGT